MQNAPLVLHLLRYYFRNSTGIFKSYKSTVSKSPGASDRRDVSNVQDREGVLTAPLGMQTPGGQGPCMPATAVLAVPRTEPGARKVSNMHHDSQAKTKELTQLVSEQLPGTGPVKSPIPTSGRPGIAP